MALRNSFQRQGRKNQAAENLLKNLDGSGCPSTKDLSFVMLQAHESAPEPQAITWQSHGSTFQLEVACRGDVAKWKLSVVDENPPVQKWTVATNDPEQIIRLLLKRAVPEQKNSNPEETLASTVSNMPVVGAMFLKRYQITKCIAKGGMGQIFQATDEVANRTVAIKVLNVFLSDDEVAKRRFEQEMKSCINLKHASIVSVYDYGYTQDATPYMVMEYLDGCTLDHILRPGGALPMSLFMQVFRQISEALRMAHDNQIIHRDIKPSNIMLIEQADSSWLIKLLDFGIAKNLETISRVTRTGEVMGTPNYMSPEQCENEPLDSRSDIYSLGCVMYQTLCGCPPFHAESPAVTMMQHIYKQPDPPTDKNSEIPKELEKIILKALAKNPHDRYQSVSELLDALKEFDTISRELKGSHSQDSCEVILPTALQLLVAAGLVESVDATAATNLKQQHGGDESQYLAELGSVDPGTYSLAMDCVACMKKFGLSIDEGVAALRYCSSKGMTLEEGLAEQSQ